LDWLGTTERRTVRSVAKKSVERIWPIFFFLRKENKQSAIFFSQGKENGYKVLGTFRVAFAPFDYLYLQTISSEGSEGVF
jgi:hypothetical protein